MGLVVDGVGLVEAAKALELALCVGGVHACAQHGGAKARALHLHQLVNQHVASGANVAREAAAAAQITGEHPVLLLDDVLSELDEGRKQYLLTCMKEKQTFVTSCDDTDFLKTDGEVYRMDGGVLNRV